MTVICPRCGENSSNSDEHCKKCGFSIKNYLDNQKRFNREANVENSINGSLSICLKEEESIGRESKDAYYEKSDDIQENIMRLLSNIKIVPSDEKSEENETINNDVQSVLEEALQDSLKEVSKNKNESGTDAVEDNNEVLSVEKLIKENALAKKEPVKIIAKKVADDVIILPPSRVKVEIEAAKETQINDIDEYSIEDDSIDNKAISGEGTTNKDEGIKDINSIKDINEETNVELTDEVVENKIKQIKEELAQNKEFIDKLEDMGMKKEEPEHEEERLCVSAEKIEEKIDKDIVYESKEKELRNREAEIHARAIPCTEGYTFREFLIEAREDNEAKKVTLIIGGAIILLIVIIMIITSTATAATL